MSSSPTSSSSTSATPGPATSPAYGPGHGPAHAGGAAGGSPQPTPFPGLMDVRMPVAIRLGSGRITVSDCLGLRPQSIVRLHQSVGQDLDLTVNGEVIATGEVAIIDDATSIRLTDVQRIREFEEEQ